VNSTFLQQLAYLLRPAPFEVSHAIFYVLLVKWGVAWVQKFLAPNFRVD